MLHLSASQQEQWPHCLAGELGDERFDGRAVAMREEILSHDGEPDFTFWAFDTFANPEHPYKDRLTSFAGENSVVRKLEYRIVYDAAQVLELDPHAGRLVAATCADPDHAAHHRDRLFAARDPELQRQASSLPTSFKLNSDQLAIIDNVVPRLVYEDPSLQRLMMVQLAGLILKGLANMLPASRRLGMPRPM
jgi:hypothetical protein